MASLSASLACVCFLELGIGAAASQFTGGVLRVGRTLNSALASCRLGANCVWPHCRSQWAGASGYVVVLRCRVTHLIGGDVGRLGVKACMQRWVFDRVRRFAGSLRRGRWSTLQRLFRLQSAMAVIEVAPELDWVRLCTRGGLQLLVHHGTGEQVALPAPEQDGERNPPWALAFDASGFGLVSRGDEVITVGGVLTFGFYRGQEDGAVRYFRQPAGGVSEWHDELSNNYMSKCFKASDRDGLFDFIAETFHYSALHRGGFVWWGMPWLRSNIFPGEAGSNWAGEHRESMERILEIFGLDCESLQPSLHAMLQLRRCHQAPDIKTSGLAHEWSVRTDAMLALCLHWARSARMKSDQRAVANHKAMEVMTVVVDHFCGSEPIALNIGEGQSLRITNCFVDFAQSDVSKRGGGALLAKAAASAPEQGRIHFLHLLQVGLSIVTVPSRGGARLVAASRSLLQSGLEVIAQQVDLSRGEAFWSATSALALRPSPRKLRVERVSPAFKEALAASAGSDSRLGGVSGLLTSQGILQKATSMKSGPSYSAKNSSRVAKESMFRYYAACREEHEDVTRWHLSLDGVRVGGEETVPPIAFAPQIGKMSFCPPQAPWVSHHEFYRNTSRSPPSYRLTPPSCGKTCNVNPVLVAEHVT